MTVWTLTFYAPCGRFQQVKIFTRKELAENALKIYESTHEGKVYIHKRFTTEY